MGFGGAPPICAARLTFLSAPDTAFQSFLMCLLRAFLVPSSKLVVIFRVEGSPCWLWAEFVHPEKGHPCFHNPFMHFTYTMCHLFRARVREVRSFTTPLRSYFACENCVLYVFEVFSYFSFNPILFFILIVLYSKLSDVFQVLPIQFVRFVFLEGKNFL